MSHSSSDENNDKNPAEARAESPAAFTSALWLRQNEEEDHAMGGAMARTHSEGAAVRGKYLADEVAAMSPFVGTQNRDYVGAFART